MEDYLAVNLAPSEDSFNKVSYLREQAYVGVFDGHGGKEAAKCAREGLWEMIQKQPKFRSSNLNTVMESVKEAYLAMHKQMEPLRGQANHTFYDSNYQSGSCTKKLGTPYRLFPN